MTQILDLLVLNCLFLTLLPQTEQISEPQNVTLLWMTDFHLRLSWTAANQSTENCSYRVTCSTSNPEKVLFGKVRRLRWEKFRVMDGGFLAFSVQTLCDSYSSREVKFNETNPVLVRDLQCYMLSSTHSQCSWIPATDAPDLNFFYEIVKENLQTAVDNNISLRACSSYGQDGDRMLCDLEAEIVDGVLILFNGTVNDKSVRNTFKTHLKYNVRIPLNWTIVKTMDNFLINWTSPGIGNLMTWTFVINYTECDDMKSLDIVGKTSTVLGRISHCPYRMAIKAVLNNVDYGTPWTKEEYFDADPNVMVYATFIIPFMFAGLAALMYVCLTRNKDKIIPKIPQPLDLLSDISDNNNKGTPDKLYISEEEENCRISLLIESQSTKVLS